jgi:type IV pilus assembly protein PilM
MAFNFKNVFSSLQKTPIVTSRKVMGIDIGSSSIKIVELEQSEDVLALSTYGELQLGPYGESNLGDIVRLPVEKKVEALVDVMRESGAQSKEGVFALSLVDSFVTIMSLPLNATEDIDSRVRVEARKYIPVPLSDVALEWSQMPALDESKALSEDIMLAAMQNTSLNDLGFVTEAVQMSSQPAEIELFSTLRAVTKSSDTSLAVIDLGAQVSKLYIAEAGFLRRLHRVQAGGAYITKALAKELSVSFEDAENIKRNFGPETKDAVKIQKLVANAYGPALSEFKRVIDQYETRTGKAIGRTVVTGGAALFPELIATMRYALNKEIELSNPFNKIAYPAFLEDTLATIAPVFTVALGAALRQFEQ